MSLDAMIWAVKDAPVADVEEHAVLTVLADEADESGCNAFLSTTTIGRRARLHERTVQRRIDAMMERGLLGLGDQTRAAYIRADRRPVVYDLLIPYTAFANVDRVNQARVDKGLPPLTPESRPDIAPAPEPKKRADAGKKKPRKENANGEATCSDPANVVEATTSHPVNGVTTSPGGLPVSHGVTSSQPRGDCKTPDPVLDPVSNPSPPSTPASVEEQKEEETTPKGTTPGLTPEETAIAAEAIHARPDWSPTAVREVLADPAIRERKVDLVREAFRAAIRTEKTYTPRRLLADACPHWTQAARALGLLADPKPVTPPAAVSPVPFQTDWTPAGPSSVAVDDDPARPRLGETPPEVWADVSRRGRALAEAVLAGRQEAVRRN